MIARNYYFMRACINLCVCALISAPLGAALAERIDGDDSQRSEEDAGQLVERDKEAPALTPPGGPRFRFNFKELAPDYTFDGPLRDAFGPRSPDDQFKLETSPGIDDPDDDGEESPQRQPKIEAAPNPLRKTPRPPPQSTPTHAEQRARALDQLFSQLAGANDQTAPVIAEIIERIWMKSGSDTADLLMQRAIQAFAEDQREAGARLLDSAIALAPKWAFAHVRRAAARIADDDQAGAGADLEEAVRIEPRQFVAYAQLGALRLKEGAKTKALEALRKSLAINPCQPTLRTIIEPLRLDAEGRDI